MRLSQSENENHKKFKQHMSLIEPLDVEEF